MMTMMMTMMMMMMTGDCLCLNLAVHFTRCGEFGFCCALQPVHCLFSLLSQEPRPQVKFGHPSY